MHYLRCCCLVRPFLELQRTSLVLNLFVTILSISARLHSMYMRFYYLSLQNNFMFINSKAGA
jgi:hypothetical protein